MSMSECMRTQTRQSGFTLIEVLVAFLMLTFALGAVYESFFLGTYGVMRAERQAQALALAQSALERTGVETPLKPGETVSSPVQDYEVRVTVAPHKSASGSSAGLGFKLYEVEVRTLWKERSNIRQLSLHTLKLAAVE